MRQAPIYAPIYALGGVGKRWSTRMGEVTSLHGVSFEVARGERVALIGPSGAGKTTLFRLLNASLRPTSGWLRFDGGDVSTWSSSRLRAMRRRIGTIHQQGNLVPSLSALENVLCGALGRWSLAHTLRTALSPARGDVEKALEALAAVGLDDKRDARADELSGGQQQRLAIARVLMQEPEVILADEPFAALDPALTDSISTLLFARAAENRTLVVTLHDVDLALRHFPRVIALRGGTVAFDAPSSEVSRAVLEDLYRSERAVRPESDPPSPRGASDARACAR